MSPNVSVYGKSGDFIIVSLAKSPDLGDLAPYTVLGDVHFFHCFVIFVFLELLYSGNLTINHSPRQANK